MWGRCWPARELAPRRRNTEIANRNIEKSGRDRSENATIFNYRKQPLLELKLFTKLQK